MWDYVSDEYFKWLYELACGNRYPEEISYRKLLMCLHNIRFRWIIPRDENRADDGIELRYRFAYGHIEVSNAELYLNGPCSVLEMMLGLAIRCEENIMDDPRVGDRTRQWFWGMIVNLGLGSMHDDRFNRQYVEKQIETFLNREYEPDGHGGLFTIRDCDRDLRDVEIWHQLCWYLDGLT